MMEIRSPLLLSESSKKRGSMDWGENDNNKKQLKTMRSGKWSPEEEGFANQLVYEFERGTLVDCDDGCTLRSYLARKLNCAPMRISKKFAGRCIGKMAFSKRHHEQDFQLSNLLQLEDLYRHSCRATNNKESKRLDRSSSITSSNNSTTSESEDGFDDINYDDEAFKTSPFMIQSRSGEFNTIFADDIENIIGGCRFEEFDTSLSFDIPQLVSDPFAEPIEWQDLLTLFNDENINCHLGANYGYSQFPATA